MKQKSYRIARKEALGYVYKDLFDKSQFSLIFHVIKLAKVEEFQKDLASLGAQSHILNNAIANKQLFKHEKNGLFQGQNLGVFLSKSLPATWLKKLNREGFHLVFVVVCGRVILPSFFSLIVQNGIELPEVLLKRYILFLFQQFILRLLKGVFKPIVSVFRLVDAKNKSIA